MGNRLEQKCKSITETRRDPVRLGIVIGRDLVMLGIVIRDSRSWTRLVSNVTEVLRNITVFPLKDLGPRS